MLDTASRTRLSLLGWTLIFAACVAVLSGVGSERTNHWTSESGPSQIAGPSRPTSLSDVDFLQRLMAWRDRRPTPAEFREVMDALNQPDWMVCGSALHVLRVHAHPQWRDARIRVLRRAAEFAIDRTSPTPSFRDWQDCLGLLREILAEDISDWTDRGGLDDLAATLIPLISNCRDGRVRARALTLLRNAPPHNWQAIVLAALDDPSERVRLAALDIVAANPWSVAAGRVELLASSPWPEVRQRALQVLNRMGQFAEPREYGDCVMKAAGQIADQIADAGVQLDNATMLSSLERGDELDVERLSESVEEYLDRSADPVSTSSDFRGVLLLAAAARHGQRKLAIRLWEREISRVDSESEVIEGGLETVARTRLLDGVAALRRGDWPAGRQAFDSVARLAHAATPHSILQVYMKLAGQLSAGAGQDVVARVDAPSAEATVATRDSMIQVALQLVDNLDLGRPEQYQEAQRRLDVLCGLRKFTPAKPNSRHVHPLAN